MQRRKNVQPDAKQHGERNAAGPPRSIGNFRKKIIRGGGLWGRNSGKFISFRLSSVCGCDIHLGARARAVAARTNSRSSSHEKLGLLVCVAPTTRTRQMSRSLLLLFYSLLSYFLFFFSFSFFSLFSSSFFPFLPRPKNPMPLKMAAIKLPVKKKSSFHGNQ